MYPTYAHDPTLTTRQDTAKHQYEKEEAPTLQKTAELQQH